MRGFDFKRAALAAAGLLLAASLPAGAEDETGQDTSPSRYELRRHEDGYMRLDTRTGAMSFCKVNNGRLTCRLGADEREAYVDSLDALQKRLSNAEERIEILETRLEVELDKLTPEEGGAQPETEETEKPLAENEHDNILPDIGQRELDRAVEITQKAVRRLFEVVQDLRREMEEKESSQ